MLVACLSILNMSKHFCVLDLWINIWSEYCQPSLVLIMASVIQLRWHSESLNEAHTELSDLHKPSLPAEVHLERDVEGDFTERDSRQVCMTIPLYNSRLQWLIEAQYGLIVGI